MDNDNLEEIDEIEEVDLGAWRVQEVTNMLYRGHREGKRLKQMK